jgi:hypothetical protein
VARWTARAPATGQGAEADQLATQHRRARELLGAYQRLRARDPARVDAIAAEARGYARVLRRLGVRNPWALELEPPHPAAIAATLAKLAAALPLALAGALLGWLPYRLAGQVARRVTRDEDLLGTVKLLAGALFLLAGWTAEATLAAVWLAPAFALPTLALGLAGGYVALRFEELVRDTAEAARYLWLRMFHRDTTRRLSERRRALADAVANALGEAG